MSDHAAFASLGEERFVSLVTFRRTGEPVPTAVWVARDGDHLIVVTPVQSGKVKRVRHDGRVELVPCSRMGKVADGATSVAGVAEVLDDDASRRRYTDLIKNKYGLEYRVIMGIERLAKGGRTPRVVLRIRSA